MEIGFPKISKREEEVKFSIKMRGWQKGGKAWFFFVVLSTSWYIFTLIISYTWTEREFKLIISVFFPDNYSCSIERVLEQYRWCGSSLFNYFKGFSMRMDLFGDDLNFKKGGIRYQTHLPTMVHLWLHSTGEIHLEFL